jgi:hypothetical protein
MFYVVWMVGGGARPVLRMAILLKCGDYAPSRPATEVRMTLEQLCANAENCAHLLEEAKDEPSRRRYERMLASWIALIGTEAWLEGKASIDIMPLPDVP